MDYIKKQFVTYEIALAVKELGFNEPCFAQILPNGDIVYPNPETNNRTHERLYINQFSGSHKNKVKAPLWQQVINWFIEEHNIDICLVCMGSEWHEYNLRQIEPFIVLSRPFAYQTYYKARKQAILKVIELIKNNNL